jgi:hypothetical protein
MQYGSTHSTTKLMRPTSSTVSIPAQTHNKAHNRLLLILTPRTHRLATARREQTAASKQYTQPGKLQTDKADL